MSNTAAKGVIVNMGEKAIRFLPLNFAALEELQVELDIVAALDAGSDRNTFFTKEERTAVLKVVTVAITQFEGNGVDADWVKRNLDLSNLPQVIAAVFNTNGFTDATAAASAGDSPAGEPLPAASENSTSQESSPKS